MPAFADSSSRSRVSSRVFAANALVSRIEEKDDEKIAAAIMAEEKYQQDLPPEKLPSEERSSPMCGAFALIQCGEGCPQGACACGPHAVGGSINSSPAQITRALRKAQKKAMLADQHPHEKVFVAARQEDGRGPPEEQRAGARRSDEQELQRPAAIDHRTMAASIVKSRVCRTNSHGPAEIPDTLPKPGVLTKNGIQ